MTEQKYFTNEEAADFLRISLKTLNNMRVSGDGPTFVKLGQRITYDRDDLIAWANRHKRNSTSDDGEALRKSA